MYGDVGFFLKKTGRFKGSVLNAMVMSGLTKTHMSKGLTMMKEGWEGGGRGRWDSERRGIRKECTMGQEREIEGGSIF